MDRIEAHRGDGDHGHVERVEEPPPLDELIADGAERDDPDEEDQDLPETFPRAHDRATATPAVASWARRSSPRSTRKRIARSPAPGAPSTLASGSSTNPQPPGGTPSRA